MSQPDNTVENLSIKFAANLLRGAPDVLRDRINVGDIIGLVLDRIDSEGSEAFKKSLQALAPSDRDFAKELDELVVARQDEFFSKDWSLLGLPHRQVARIIADTLERFLGDQTDLTALFPPKIQEVQATLSLTDQETAFLALIVVRSGQHGVFQDALNEDRIWYVRNLPKYLGAAIGVDDAVAKRLFAPDGRLFQHGLLSRSAANEPLEPMQNLVDYLNGVSAHTCFLDSLFEPNDATKLAQRPPCVSAEEWDLVTSLIRGREQVHLLLHGLPGTGKTTLVRAVAQHLGLRIVNIATPESGEQKHRIANLRCAAAIAATSPGLLIVIDEADRLLSAKNAFFKYGDQTDKGWLNKFLESEKVRTIWITNGVSSIDTSTMRRFAYKLEFRPYTRRERQAVWSSLLETEPSLKDALDSTELSALVSRYPLQPAEIADSVHHVTGLSLSRDRIRPVLERCLESHLRAKGEAPLAETRSNGFGSYSLAGLNADTDLVELAAKIERFAGHLRQPQVSESPQNLHVLLAGPPGTGKTEFAKFLAEAAGMDLVTRTASELKSPYVGMTEKQVARAFSEAEKDHAILFIDEADSFIWPRENAQRSWEVSETNEFLCRMERFRGILVCATNSVQRVDSAAFRRFAFRVTFDMLTPDGSVEFYSRFFGTFAAAVLQPADEAALREVPNLTPGDFKAVRQRLAYNEPATITAAVVIQELRKESRFKIERGGGGRIGFGGKS